MQGGIPLVISNVNLTLPLVKEKSLHTLFMAVGAGKMKWSVAMVISGIDTATITKREQLWRERERERERESAKYLRTLYM